MPHLVDHAVRSAAELADLLQVVGLHLEVLPPNKQKGMKRVATDPEDVPSLGATGAETAANGKFH